MASAGGVASKGAKARPRTDRRGGDEPTGVGAERRGAGDTDGGEAEMSGELTSEGPSPWCDSPMEPLGLLSAGALYVRLTLA
jgi:hypothetical protein